MKDTPYGWRLSATAALRWARVGQQKIEERLTVIMNDDSRKDEFRQAKRVWQSLRHMELGLALALDETKKGAKKMEHWITVESFGTDVPANWEEIKAYLNDIIRDRGIENDASAVNEVWEAFWQGEFPDAPVVKEERVIYLVHDEPADGSGDSYQTHPCSDVKIASNYCYMTWWYLTRAEKLSRHVYVGAHRVLVPLGDRRSDKQVYDDLRDEGEWPNDHDVVWEADKKD